MRSAMSSECGAISFDRSFREAKSFYTLFTGGDRDRQPRSSSSSPARSLGLLITESVQALAGVAAPVATRLYALLLCNDVAVLGPWVNGPWLNVLAATSSSECSSDLSGTLVITTLFSHLNAAADRVWLASGSRWPRARWSTSAGCGSLGRAGRRRGSRTPKLGDVGGRTLQLADAAPCPAQARGSGRQGPSSPWGCCAATWWSRSSC